MLELLSKISAQTRDTPVQNLQIEKGPLGIFLTNFDIKNGTLVVIFLRLFLRQVLLSKEVLSPKFRGNRNKSKKSLFLLVPPSNAEEIVSHVVGNKSRKYIVWWQGYDADNTNEEPPQRFGTELPFELLEKVPRCTIALKTPK